MEDHGAVKGHRLLMTDCASCSLTGIRDVIAFDEKEVQLDTEQGLLNICGEGMHVKKLTLEKGELDMEGHIDSIRYSVSRKASKESLVHRIFR